MLLTEQAARLQCGDWAPFFAAECAKPYFAALDAFVTEAAAHTTVYPAAENIFAAFAACPAAGIRAVILGQDPYHEPGQAMGLSFSVPDACKAPPSLRNIFKELENETGTQRAHNDLTPWAQQGVLLLNTVPLPTPSRAGRLSPRPRWNTPCSRAMPPWPLCCGASPPKSTRRCLPLCRTAAPCWCWNLPTPARFQRTVGSLGRHPLVRSTPFCSSTEKQRSIG